MLYRNEFLDLLFKSMRTSDHRFFGYPILKQDLWHIGKLPAMLQSAQPEIPVFPTLNWHGAIVSAVLLPNRTPIDGTSINVIPLEQLIPVKRATMPTPRTHPDIFSITIDDANLCIGVQNSNSMLDIARAQTVVC